MVRSDLLFENMLHSDALMKFLFTSCLPGVTDAAAFSISMTTLRISVEMLRQIPTVSYHSYDDLPTILFR